MAVFIMDRIAPEAVALLREYHEVVDFPLSRQGDWQAQATALVVRTFEVRQADIDRSARLRIIAKHGAGVDNIDIRAAQRKGIIVANTPGANANAVAEYVLALALALARGLVHSDRDVRRGVSGRTQEGFELHGATLGLVGLGAIGARTGRLFKAAFSARVAACDPFAPAGTFLDCGAVRVPALPDLLREADVVSLHVPLLDSTRHLIGAAELEMMKPSAILINTARGGIVDEAALYQALLQRRIAGAAADVFEVEPPSPAHPLLGLDNFVGSSHLAGSSRQSLQAMGLGAARAVLAGLSGGMPDHVLAYE